MLRSTRIDPSSSRSSTPQAPRPRWPSSRARARAGFTLIELMIVVAILGVLSAIAIPAFRTLMYRAKTAEAPMNLALLFKGAASYYNSERSAIGQTGQQLRACTVDDAGPLPAPPGKQKQEMPNTDPTFQALAFKSGDLVYYAYGVESGDPGGMSACEGAPSRAAVYTFYANGDLNGDAKLSIFELAVGSDVNNELFHSRGVYITNELE